MQQPDDLLPSHLEPEECLPAGGKGLSCLNNVVLCKLLLQLAANRFGPKLTVRSAQHGVFQPESPAQIVLSILKHACFANM